MKLNSFELHSKLFSSVYKLLILFIKLKYPARLCSNGARSPEVTNI